MNTWSSRIKSKMKELDMTQEELARKLGITRGAITHYLAERRVPPLQQFQKIAAVLKVDPAWLQYGTRSENKIVTPVKSKTSYFPIPILTWAQAAERSQKFVEHIPHFYTDQSHWYALCVKGDSMVSATGLRSFHEGDFIIIDTEKEVTHGDFIVAVLPRSKEAIFKQYVIDGGVKYLKPLNTQYPLIQMDNKTLILGVVKHTIYNPKR